jgi:hypothetical protein
MISRMGATIGFALLLTALFGVTSVTGVTITTSAPCAWSTFRAGVVRDTLYIDGGYGVYDDGKTQWNPTSSLFEFKYNTSFDFGHDAKPDILTLVDAIPLSAYDAPLYYGGAIFADDYEFYTYG